MSPYFPLDVTVFLAVLIISLSFPERLRSASYLSKAKKRSPL